MSFLIRSQPADYGLELMEFDPFFNFRATEYIVENGFIEYFEWEDDNIKKFQTDIINESIKPTQYFFGPMVLLD